MYWSARWMLDRDTDPDPMTALAPDPICDHGRTWGDADRDDQAEALAAILILLVMGGGVAGVAAGLIKALGVVAAPPEAIAALGQALIDSTRPDDQVLGSTRAP